LYTRYIIMYIDDESQGVQAGIEEHAHETPLISLRADRFGVVTAYTINIILLRIHGSRGTTAYIINIRRRVNVFAAAAVGRT